jgi:hypothetical protein
MLIVKSQYIKKKEAKQNYNLKKSAAELVFQSARKTHTKTRLM